MHPTQKPPGLDPTPADILRCAALYLDRHGLHRGDMFANLTQLTPPACVQGAIQMAACGGTTAPHAPGTIALVDETTAVLADHLCHGAYLASTDPGQRVADWNDQPGRTATQAAAVLHAAADDWDRVYGGAR